MYRPDCPDNEKINPHLLRIHLALCGILEACAASGLVKESAYRDEEDTCCSVEGVRAHLTVQEVLEAVAEALEEELVSGGIVPDSTDEE